MNFLMPVFRTGMQRYALFLNFQTFSQKFFDFFKRQSFKELIPFSKGLQRYYFFLNLQIYSLPKTASKCHETQKHGHNSLILKTHNSLLQIC